MAKGMPIATALQQLGLTNSATEQDVKQAYKDLARIWHPDRFQNDERLGEKTEAQIKLINEARSVSMAYLDKHGHFLHVGRDQKQKSRTRPPGKTSYGEQQKRPGQKPPRPEPKKERTKQNQPHEEKAPPRPEQKKKDTKQASVDSGFQMDQGNWVVLFITLFLVGFLAILVSSVTSSPEDKLEKLTQKIQLSNEKSDLRKEWDARRAKESVVIEKELEQAPPVVAIDTFFTLGSNKAWVSTVQGPPHQIRGREWHYGSSIVHFAGGTVIGWSSAVSDPLKIGMAVDSIWYFPNPYFEIGSFKEEVIALQGAPDILENKVWTYGEAIVEFEADTVVYWENDRQNSLKAQ